MPMKGPIDQECRHCRSIGPYGFQMSLFIGLLVPSGQYPPGRARCCEGQGYLHQGTELAAGLLKP
jgi:hypothetical protein